MPVSVATESARGLVEVYQQRDGKFDLSVISPLGPSAATYMTDVELLGFAIEVIARYAHESGLEIGEAVEAARGASR